MLLGEIITNNRVQFVDGAGDWEEAIRISCKSLIDDKTINPKYADEIISAVRDLGPYIVLMPGFALPHAMKNSSNANGTAIAFTKFSRPVSFIKDSDEKDASVFFTLAARDNEEHLKNMRKLWKMLTNEELCVDLLRAATLEELMALDTKYS
jgi:PTS system ascorbate-specific IIA component